MCGICGRSRENNSHILLKESKSTEILGMKSTIAATKRHWCSADFKINDMEDTQAAKRFYKCIKTEMNKTINEVNSKNQIIDSLEKKIRELEATLSKIATGKCLNAEFLISSASEMNSEKPKQIWRKKWKVVKRNKAESTVGTHEKVSLIKSDELKFSAKNAFSPIGEENNGCMVFSDLKSNKPFTEESTVEILVPSSTYEVKTETTCPLEDENRNSLLNKFSIKINELKYMDEENNLYKGSKEEWSDSITNGGSINIVKTENTCPLEDEMLKKMLPNDLAIQITDVRSIKEESNALTVFEWPDESPKIENTTLPLKTFTTPKHLYSDFDTEKDIEAAKNISLKCGKKCSASVTEVRPSSDKEVVTKSENIVLARTGARSNESVLRDLLIGPDVQDTNSEMNENKSSKSFQNCTKRSQDNPIANIMQMFKKIPEVPEGQVFSNTEPPNLQTSYPGYLHAPPRCFHRHPQILHEFDRIPVPNDLFVPAVYSNAYIARNQFYNGFYPYSSWLPSLGSNHIYEQSPTGGYPYKVECIPHQSYYTDIC